MNRIIIAVLVFFAIVQTPQTSYSQNHKWCVGDCMVNHPPPGSEGGPAGSPGGGITPEEACSMTDLPQLVVPLLKLVFPLLVQSFQELEAEKTR